MIALRCRACGQLPSGYGDGLGADDHGVVGGLGGCGDAHDWPVGGPRGPRWRPTPPTTPPAGVIIGASDPEAEAIEAMARRAGLIVLHAVVWDRGLAVRVAPGEAYRATGAVCSIPDRDRLYAWMEQAQPIRRVGGCSICIQTPCPNCGAGELEPPPLNVIEIECARAHADEPWSIHGTPYRATTGARCDHHRPGDLGFGLPPELAVEASSIGQFAALLGVELSERERIIAACDHALAAAYAGRVPGVSAEAVREHRRGAKAAWLLSGEAPPAARAEVAAAVGRAPRVLDDAPGAWRAAIDAATTTTAAALRRAPRIDLGGVDVLDVRTVGTLPLLPDVCAEQGVAALYRMPLPRGSGAKVGIIGGGEGSVPGTAPVEAFLAAARAGEVAGTRVDPASTYGDPARGYAGATVADGCV